MPRRAVRPPVSEERAAPGGVAAVDRALSLLGVFSTEAPLMSLSELAERTQQYKSTVLRLLASLEYANLLRRHTDGRFGMGAAIARLHAVYSASMSMGDIVLPALRLLVDRTRESASFHVRNGEHDLCLYRVDSPLPIRDHLRAGDMSPLDASPAGLVMRAFEGKRGTRYARVRKEGELIDDGRLLAEVGAIASPVYSATGLAGVLVLTMPCKRLKPELAKQVRATAQGLSGHLGGPQEPMGRCP